MVKHLGTGTWFGLVFGLVLGVVAGVAGASYWGTNGSTRTSAAILPGNVKFAEQAARAQADALQLRRYAKTMLLTVNSPGKLSEYRKKWGEHRALQMARFDDLEKNATRKEDMEFVKAMRKELADYDAGFTNVLGQIEAGTIKTPQQAYRAMNSRTPDRPL